MMNIEEIEALREKRCARCGHKAGKHHPLFGSTLYLCPTIETFQDYAAGEDALADWVPEFTVWIVRRGSRYPMVVDSIFMAEVPAVSRAALLGVGEGWRAEKYSHLQAPQSFIRSGSAGDPAPREE